MKILFLTLLDFSSYSDHNIYCDLIREFIENGHDVYCISPVEKRYGGFTHFEENNHLLKLKIGNTQKTNIFEKGISTLLIEPQFIKAIKEYFNDVCFDLVMYSTPPITFYKAICFIKKRDNAKTYLLLKDIFPQNAVDLGLMSEKGIQGIIYRYFRNKEIKLYAVSDRIGCMSQANVDYLLSKNPEISSDRVEICPNSIEFHDMRVDEDSRNTIRHKYNIPIDKKVFVYGGNLGKPQGIDFLINCLEAQMNNDNAFFLLVGDGTEYTRIEDFINKNKPANIRLMRRMPKEDFDIMIAACDIGLIFLDYRFSIPNFPSRLLAYMQAGLPVLACTDPNSDIGKVITENSFGWWIESNSVSSFNNIISEILDLQIYDNFSDNSINYLKKHYCVENQYKIIVGSSL